MHYLTDVLKKYFVLSGRASRKEYWMFQLLLMTVMTVVMMVISVILSFMVKDKESLMRILWIFMAIYFIFYLAILPPSLAVFVRRLHDVSKSGWWFFIGFIPFIGGIWLLVLLVTEGDHGSNEYGPDPYAITSPAPVAPAGMTSMPAMTTPILEAPLGSTPTQPLIQADIDAVVIKPELPVSEF